MYFTINDSKTLIDSISENFYDLKNKFPNKHIYIADKIVSIYVKPENLIELSLL